MLDVPAVIRHFGPIAIRMLHRKGEWDWDEKAIAAVKGRDDPNRVETVRAWLQSYGVFQGIPGPKRAAIAETFLAWADLRGTERNVGSLDELCEAQQEIRRGAEDTLGKSRDFTSLASKALWLKYPNDVPLFDSFAQRALWFIGKVEVGVALPPPDGDEYRRFALVWRALYQRHAQTLAGVDARGYPYGVRIFDRILWLLGEPQYFSSEEPRTETAST